MSTTKSQAAPRIISFAKNDWRGMRVGEIFRVCGIEGQNGHMLHIANTMASAVRLSGGQARIVPGKGGHLVRRVTYSRDAGYLWGRPTGELFVEVEVIDVASPEAR